MVQAEIENGVVVSDELHPVVVLTPDIVETILLVTPDEDLLAGLSERHPDIDRVGYTLTSLRATTSHNDLDHTSYLAGLTAFLYGRSKQAGGGEEPLYEVAGEYVKFLAGIGDKENKDDLEKFNDASKDAYKKNPSWLEIAEFESSQFPDLTRSVKTRTDVIVSTFEKKQPNLLMAWEKWGFLSHQPTESEGMKYSVMQGMIDGHMMFEHAADMRRRAKTERAQIALSDYMKKPLGKPSERFKGKHK